MSTPCPAGGNDWASLFDRDIKPRVKLPVSGNQPAPAHSGEEGPETCSIFHPERVMDLQYTVRLPLVLDSHARGQNYAQSGGTAALREHRDVPEVKEPVAAVATEAQKSLELRLRKRGRVTNSLARTAVRLGWWSDLTSPNGSAARAWFRQVFDSKEAGQPQLASDAATQLHLGGEGVAPLDLLEVIFTNDNGVRRAMPVCPELLAKLMALRVFRAPSAGLVGSFRSRARLWAEERGVSPMDLVCFLPGTLILAMVPTAAEADALATLRGPAGVWANEVLTALDKGQLRRAPEREVGWGEVLKWPFNLAFDRPQKRGMAPVTSSLGLST